MRDKLRVSLFFRFQFFLLIFAIKSGTFHHNSIFYFIAMEGTLLHLIFFFSIYWNNSTKLQFQSLLNSDNKHSKLKKRRKKTDIDIKHYSILHSSQNKNTSESHHRLLFEVIRNQKYSIASPKSHQSKRSQQHLTYIIISESQFNRIELNVIYIQISNIHTIIIWRSRRKNNKNEEK